MTEAKRVLYAEAKPESKIVSHVRSAIKNWVERIGPKGVQNHFVQEHQKILKQIPEGTLRKSFAKEIKFWREMGRKWGVAATVIDSSLIAVGLAISLRHRPDAYSTARKYGDVLMRIFKKTNENNHYTSPFAKIFLHPFTVDNEGYSMTFEDAVKFGNKLIRIPTGVATLGLLFTSGPAHAIAHLAARSKGALTETQLKIKTK